MKFDKSLSPTNFMEMHNKLFQVLIVISFLIADSALKRQCIRVANVFESTNTIISKRLIEYLDNGLFPGEGVGLKNKMNVLNDLRILLGNFDEEVKRNIKMDDRIGHYLPESFEHFKYFSKNQKGQKILAPIRYPGIEPGFKRHDSDDEDEKNSKNKLTNGKNEDKAIRNYSRIHSNNKLFLARMSDMFKNIHDPEVDSVEDRTPINQYTSKQVRDFYLSVAPMCNGFYVKNGELYFRIDKISEEELHSYKQYTEKIMKDNFNASKAHLKHDFTKYERFSYNFEPINLDRLYEEGQIDVWKLTSNGFNHFDISNILFCSILHKKWKFGENFHSLNLNRDEELSQLKKVFNYMTFRGQPEYSRLVLLPTVIKNYFTMMDYNSDVYKYEMNTLNKYRYSKKKLGQDEEEETAETLPVVQSMPLAAPNNSEILVQKVVKPKPEKKVKPEGSNYVEMIKKHVQFIQESLAMFLSKQITIDVKNLMELQAMFVDKPQMKSEIFVTLCKKNTKAEQRNKVQKTVIEISAPERIEGNFEALIEENHDVGYDEKFEPFVRTTMVLKKINGNLLFFNTLNSFRVELDILDELSMKGKIKISSRLDPTIAPQKSYKKNQKDKAPKWLNEGQNLNLSTPPIQNKLPEIKTVEQIVAHASIPNVLPQNQPIKFQGQFQSSIPYEKPNHDYLTNLIISQLNAPPAPIPKNKSTNIALTSQMDIHQNVPKIVSNQNQARTPISYSSPAIENENLNRNQHQIITEVVYPATVPITSNCSQFSQQFQPSNNTLEVPVRETSVIKLSPNKAVPVPNYANLKTGEAFSEQARPQPVAPKTLDKIVIQEDIVISQANIQDLIGTDMDFEDALLASVLPVNNDFAERMRKEKDDEMRIEQDKKEEKLKKERLKKEREEFMLKQEMERQRLENERKAEEMRLDQIRKAQEELVRKEKEEILRLEQEKNEKEKLEIRLKERECELERCQREQHDREIRKNNEKDIQSQSDKLRRKSKDSSSDSDIANTRKSVRLGSRFVINPLSLLQKKRQKMSDRRIHESNFITLEENESPKIKPFSVQATSILSDVSGKDFQIYDNFEYSALDQQFKKVCNTFCCLSYGSGLGDLF